MSEFIPNQPVSGSVPLLARESEPSAAVEADPYMGAPPECLERICEAHWAGAKERQTVDGVTFLRIYQHNACNHTLAGTIDHEGQTFGFILDNGDWAGTVVRAWGDPEDVGQGEDPEPPEPRTFLPNNRGLFWERPHMWAAYLLWRKEPWFLEMERGYNYDRHFQPGGFVEGHYAQKAAKRGLRVGYLSDLSADERASILGKVARPPAKLSPSVLNAERSEGNLAGDEPLLKEGE